MSLVKFEPGEAIFAEGEPSSYVLRIVTGEVAVTKKAGGQVIVIARLRPGDFAGEMGVIQGRPRGASLRAESKVSAERQDRDAFLEMVAGNSALAFGLLQRLSERLASLDRAYAEIAAAQGGPLPPAAPLASPVTAGAAGGLLLTSDLLPAEGVRIETLPFVVGRRLEPGDRPAPLKVDLRLDDLEPYRLSRAHFRIEAAAWGFRVRDLDSHLGTYANGVPLGHDFTSDRAALSPGENEIVAGGLESPFRFTLKVAAGG